MMGVRRPRKPKGFRRTPADIPRAIQGPLYLWFDPHAQVGFITIGIKQPAENISLGNGVGLRFDLLTQKFVGFSWIMLSDEPIRLPVWAVLTLMKDELPPRAVDR